MASNKVSTSTGDHRKAANICLVNISSVGKRGNFLPAVPHVARYQLVCTELPDSKISSENSWLSRLFNFVCREFLLNVDLNVKCSLTFTVPQTTLCLNSQSHQGKAPFCKCIVSQVYCPTYWRQCSGALFAGPRWSTFQMVRSVCLHAQFADGLVVMGFIPFASVYY